MTKADIVEQVAQATGLTKVETEAVLDGIIFYIIDSLKRGERVDMRGFGSFLVKNYFRNFIKFIIYFYVFNFTI